MEPTALQSVLGQDVAGVNLVPGTLRDQLAPGPNLLVFLRHFGCAFCRETVSELRAIADKDPDYPPVLFFFQGKPTEGRVFLSRYWPTARAVADRAKRFYNAFGVERGNIRELFGVEVWRDRRRAAAGGHKLGWPTADPFMMPGVFLVDDQRIRWKHEFRNVSDHPDFAQIPKLAAAAPA